MKINVQRVKSTLALFSATVVIVVFKRFSLTNNHKPVAPPPTATCFIKVAEKEAENVSIQKTQEIPSSSIHFIQSNLTVQKPYSSSISNYPFATIDISNVPVLRKVTDRIVQCCTDSPSEKALIQKSENQFASMVAARYYLQKNFPIRNPPMIAVPAQATIKPVEASSSRVVMPPSKMDMVQSIEDNTIDAPLFQTEADFYDRTYGWGVSFEFEVFQTQKKVKPSQTRDYAFQTRNRIQRERNFSGEYSLKETISIDPFLPTHQLFREMCDVQDEFDNSSEQNQPILQIDSGNPRMDSENLVAPGLANLIANAHNQTLLNNLTKSRYYNDAAALIHNDLASKLNIALENDSISGIKDNNSISSISGISNISEQSIEVHVNNVEVLNKLSEYIKILESADNISEKDYKVSFTGEKNEKDLNTFTNNPIYNRASFLRSKIKKNLENQNNNPLSFTVALSSEDILSKVQQIQPENQVISHLSATILDITENQGSEKTIIDNLMGSTDKPLKPLTYESEIDGDHWLRKNSRAALKQRLLNTKPTNDQARCVELPIPVHVAKETVKFTEPEDINYSQGLDTYLNAIEKRVDEKINECSPSDLYHMPAEKYKEAYSACHKVKIKDLNQRYPTLTSREKFMVYRAELASLSDEEDLNSFLENQLSAPFSLEDRVDNKILRNTVVGQNIQTNLDLSADLARKVAGEKGGFIKTLGEFCSPDCAKVLENIQERHQSLIKLRFSEIKEFTHELSLKEEKQLLQPESLTNKLFEKYLKADSEYLSINDLPQHLIDDVLYKHAKFLGLTDVGNKLPSPSRLITLQQEEKTLTEFGLKNPVKFAYLETHNDTLNKQLLEEELTGNYCKLPEFETVKAQELHNFLTKNETKLPKSLADLLVKKYGIHNLDELQTKTNDRSLLNEIGFGEKKLNQVQTFFTTLESQQTKLQSNLDIVATLEEQTETPGPIDPVFCKAVNKVFNAGSKYKIEITQKNVSNEAKAQTLIECIETSKSEETERRKIVADMVSTIMQNVVKNNQ